MKRRIRNKRKEIIKEIATYIFIIVGLFILLPSMAGYIETHYDREGTVVEIVDNKAIILDNCGYKWSVANDSLEVGNKIAMKMYNNHTSTIKDDEIIKIKIKG